jgi:hypothetical protein
VKVLIFFII